LRLTSQGAGYRSSSKLESLLSIPQQSSMMKLLFYNHTGTVSGAERVLMLVLAQLDRNEFAPLVLCPATGSLRAMIAAAEVPWLEAAELRARFTWRPDHLLGYLRSIYRVGRDVRRQIRSAAPDLIHANSIRAGLVMTLATAGLGVPVIWHLHDLLPRHPLSTAIRLCALASSRRRLLAVSGATADRFRGTLLRRAPVAVLLNAADTDRFRPDAASRRTIRAELGLSETAPVIGIIGQVTERKGQLGLLHAFASVVRQLPQAVLLVAGAPLFTEADQQYHERLTRAAEQLGLAQQVRFLGARGDVPALMQALDVLVVNSLAEPCGLVVLEGMASGVPVIATAVGGNPEMIEHNHSGWLVPSGDEQALAAAILKLIREPHLRAHLGRNARARVLARFSVSSYLAGLTDFYRASVGATLTPDARHLIPVGNKTAAPEDHLSGLAVISRQNDSLPGRVETD
jgi:glycosyltransferase involved in cell wall biosynthesis